MRLTNPSVAEFIEHLKTYPQDAVIMMPEGNRLFTNTFDFEETDGGKFVNSVWIKPVQIVARG